MDCDKLSYDNRETCVAPLPSSCVPYTGEINDIIKADLPLCKPNINDIFKSLQTLIDKIQKSLGDNKTLDKECLTFAPATVTQKELNQIFVDELCEIKTILGTIDGGIDPATIKLAVDLLCLIEPLCEPKEEYTLTEIITKLVAAYCSLLTRVTNIEILLNI